MRVFHSEKTQHFETSPLGLYMIIRRHIIYCLREDLEKAINSSMWWGETVESSLCRPRGRSSSNLRRFGAFQMEENARRCVLCLCAVCACDFGAGGFRMDKTLIVFKRFHAPALFLIKMTPPLAFLGLFGSCGGRNHWEASSRFCLHLRSSIKDPPAEQEESRRLPTPTY